MSTAILNATINVFGAVKANEYDGVLTIHSKEQLIIDHIDGIVYLEARGRMSSTKKQIISFKIDTRKNIMQNESYEVPFSFVLPDSDLETYSGKNVTISYSCEAKIYVNEEDLEKLDRGLATRLKSFFTSDYSTKVSGYFNKFNIQEQYKVGERHRDFKLAFNGMSLLYSILIIGALYLLGMYTLHFEFNVAHIFLSLIAIAILSFIQFSIKKRKIGGITLTTVNLNDGFICNVKPARNFSLRKAKIHYQIIEKVVDRRGTSSTTYTETIYKSPVYPLKSKGSSEVEFKFPENKRLGSMKFEDASLYWEIVIQGMHSGISEKLTCAIDVTKA